MSNINFRKLKARKAKFGYEVHVNGDNMLDATQKIRELTGGWPQGQETWFMEVSAQGIYTWAYLKVYVNDPVIGANFEAVIESQKTAATLP